MRFIFAKHTLNCKYCSGEIFPRELFCRTFHRNKQTGATFGFCYHYECYIEDYVERIRKSALFWKSKLTPQKKRGRPTKSSYPKAYRKLMALKRYHEKLEHTDRVIDIENKIKELQDANI